MTGACEKYVCEECEVCVWSVCVKCVFVCEMRVWIYEACLKDVFVKCVCLKYVSV